MRGRTIRTVTGRAVAVAFALLLVTSVIGTAGATAGSTQDAAESAADRDVARDLENGTADDIYRYANGSAVLVYEEEATGSEDIQTAQFGADVSSALVNAVVVSSYDNQQGTTGDVQLMVTPDSVSGSGDLTLNRPEQLQNLNATLEGEVTPEDSGARFTLDAAYQQQGFSSTPSVDTAGEFVVKPDALEMTADYTVDSPGSTAKDSNLTVDITETESGYEVAFDQNRPVNQFRRSDWNTTEAARQTIRSQYQGLTFQYGGSVEVTIESHEYTPAPTDSSESDRLDIEYTVTLTGVESGVADQVVNQLSRTQEMELSSAQQEALRENFTELTVDGVEVSVNQSGSVTEGSADLAISGYEDLTVNYIDVLASSSEAVNQSDVNKLQQQLEARSAANLQQSLSWDVDVSSGETGTDVQADIEYDTQNWNAYTSELADRGMPLETNLQFSGEAYTEGESVEVNMTFDVTQEALVDSAVSQAVDAAEGADSANQSTVEAFRALEDAQLQVAKADVVFGKDTVEVRASAQFENLSTMQSAVDQFPSDVPITQIYAEQSEGTTTTYVYVENLGMSDAELRESDLANDATTIHQPGEWERTFPNMDIASSAEYLGVDAEVNNPPNSGGPGTTATPTPVPGDTDGGAADTTTSDGPGFGLAVALVALLVASLVAARRRD